MKKLWLALLLIVTCPANATEQAFAEAPPPPAGKALVYIYRPQNKLHNLRSGGFYIDLKRIVLLKDDGYTWLHLSEGTHTLEHRKTSNPNDERVGGKMLFTGGRTYYFRLEVGLGSRDVHWLLSEQPAATARAEIEKCSYQKPTNNTP